jgi:predicted branched-subunit amino acid permease
VENEAMIRFAAYRTDLLAGTRAMTPWLIGVAPFGLVIGISAAQASIPTLAGWLTGPLIYAGSAQVAAIQMLDAGAAPLAVVLTVLVINLRLVLYSATMASYWRGTPLWWRLLCGYLLIDPSFAVGIERYSQEHDRRRAHAHYLGGAVALWVTWLAAIAVGATVAAGVPASLHLELLIPLYLIGEIIPKLRMADTRLAALVAGGVALACLAVPMHLGIAIGIISGIAAASLTRGRSAPNPPRRPYLPKAFPRKASLNEAHR